MAEGAQMCLKYCYERGGILQYKFSGVFSGMFKKIWSFNDVPLFRNVKMLGRDLIFGRSTSCLSASGKCSSKFPSWSASRRVNVEFDAFTGVTGSGLSMFSLFPRPNREAPQVSLYTLMQHVDIYGSLIGSSLQFQRRTQALR